MSAKIKELIRSGWPIMQMGYLVNDWKYSGNLQPKTGMGEKQLLQNPGYVGVVGEMRAALLHACRIFFVVVRDVGEGLNYILYYNLNYLN